MAASSRVPTRRRSGFSRRLALWASRGRRWTLQPLACAVVLVATHAESADLRLPKAIAAGQTLNLRGKTFTWQPSAQGSVLGSVVATKDASGNTTSVSQTLTQTVKRGLYNWETFDIGTDASFEINMTAGDGSAALNRVVNSVNPSEIFGALKSNGEVFLINRNGVLFGAKSQVNVQGLIASTLDISDTVFLNGLSTVDKPEATFAWEGDSGVSTFDSPNNYVIVEQGGQIKTPSGGRVILMARKVENRGVIDTTSGQTALLAGSKVYIKSPDKEPMYASEVNAAIPSLRGFLFEVDGQGEANNLGTLISSRGNTTMMGYIVRQQGRIQATTSVTENGSVFLLARTDAITDSPAAGEVRQVANTSGSLELGAGSSITISPDNSVSAAGSVQMQVSRIELAGKTIDIGENAKIVAPGATVNVRAEAKPDYNPVSTLAGYATTSGDASARVVMRKGATIDVSGTTDTQLSVATNFVTTEFLRNADLSGNPMFKDGALINTKVTYDTRSAPTVLEAASHLGYANSITSTAGQRMAQGGSVTLASTGAVLMQGGSQVNVSGGKVTYTAAEVAPTQLKGADGKTYTLNTASTSVQIVGVSGQQAADATRYGNVTPNEASAGYIEAGYTQGGNGGVFQVQANKLVMEGSVKASTIVGQRQAQGLDARARLAAVRLGVGNLPSLAGGVTLSKTPTLANPVLWDDPLNAALPERTDVSVAMLNDSGAGQISITTEGGVKLADGATLQLADTGSLTLKSRGSEGVVIDGDIRGAGATVSLSTDSSLDATNSQAGGITLAAGRQIDVSGNFVNKRQSGGLVADAVAGGQVIIKSAAGLDLQTGSAIKVSGGATVSTAKVVTGTRAGAITLEANNAAALNSSTLPIDKVFAPVTLNATLEGYALAGSTSKALGDVGSSLSGKLAIKVGDVEIVKGEEGQAALSAGRALDGIRLTSAFFNQGGFSQFDIEGVRQLDVRTGATVAPTPRQWVAKSTAANAATGSSLSKLATATLLPQFQRPTSAVTLKSRGLFDNVRAPSFSNGALTLEAGSLVQAGPAGKVTLTGGRSLVIQGAVQASGGQITTDLVGVDTTADIDSHFAGTYLIGKTASLDVSGSTLFSSTVTTKRREGTVLDGGTINLNLGTDGKVNTAVVVEKGAVIKANGASDSLNVTALNAQGVSTTTRQQVDSNAGTINVTASAAGALLAGELSAQAGGTQARGGALNISINNDGSTKTPKVSIVVQQAAVAATQATRGEVTVSADAVKAGGFQDLGLHANGAIETLGNVSLGLPGTLVLDAPTLAARTAGDAVMAAGSRLVRTNAFLGNGPDATTGGLGKLTLSADVVDFLGTQSTRNIGTFNVLAGSEARFTALTSGKADVLSTAADLHITAPQVTVSTDTTYTVDATGHTVTIDGGDTSVAKPLSAGGHLTIVADEIAQNGVVRAPFGQITLKAGKITLGAGSETSVSGDGISVPYGTTSENGSKWTLNGATLLAPTEKAIALDAGSGEIDIQSNATLDTSGGGQMLGWEFVSGPGGTKDVFQGTYDSGSFAIVPTVKGVAPIDPAILTASGATDLARYSAMRQITFGEGGPVPAGTYTILPARYALLAGGFLIRTTKTTPMSLGNSVSLANGSYLVGATVGTRGGSLPDAQAATFEVLTQQTAKRYSEIKESTVDAFFSAQATRLGVTAPRLAADAGAVNLVGNKMALQGALKFDRGTGGRGGELNIASDLIVVGNASDVEGGLHLDVAQLNATGVDSLLLGGTRTSSQADGSRLVDVRASEVIVATDAANPLALGDVVLAANNTVTVRKGSVINASAASVKAEALTLAGDGALVRVSADDEASSVRVNLADKPIARARGQVDIQSGAALIGGGVTVEATQRTQIADTADIRATQLTVGAARIAVGSGAAAQADASTLVIGTQLANRLSSAQRAILRSFDGIDLVGNAQVGSTAQKALTLDTSQINLLPLESGATTAVVEAGTVTLTNTTGLSGSGTVGDGTLTIKATGAQGADGHIHVRDGVVAVDGAATTTLDAAGSVMVHSGRTAVVDPSSNETIASVATTSGVLTGGAMAIQAQSLALDAGAVGKFKTESGDFTLNTKAAANGVTAATASPGGILSVVADGVNQLGLIDAPSGAVTLKARTGDVVLGSASKVLADGRIWTVDGVKVATPGGTVSVVSDAGNVTLREGALISASAPAGVANAQSGQVSLSAPKGVVTLDGTVRVLSDANQKGGSFTVDAFTAPTVADIVAKLNKAAQPLVDGAATRLNAAERFELHQRDGHIDVDANTTVASRNIKMVTDNGNVTVLGTLNASASQAGAVSLIASGDVVLGDGGESTAQVLAVSSGDKEAGGALSLASTSGMVNILSNAAVDLTGGAGAAGGTLTLRAKQTTTANKTDGGVNVAPIEGSLTGLGSLVVQGEVVHDVSTLDAALLTQIKKENTAFLTAANTKATLSKIVNGKLPAATRTMLQAAQVLQSTDDLSLNTAWNLSEFTLVSGKVVASTAAPMDLTIRTAGTLNIAASISSGLSGNSSSGGVPTTLAQANAVNPLGLIQSGDGANINLVGGADLNSADRMATLADARETGQVVIGDESGNSVVVRTTTGNINIASAGNTSMLNTAAAVYTTGRLATAAETTGLVGLYTSQGPSELPGGTTKQVPFLTGGGAVNLSVGGDLALINWPDSWSDGAPYVDQWMYIKGQGKTTVSDAYWTRYDKYNQGFATFGGGAINAVVGGNVRNLAFVTATSGYKAKTGEFVRFGGGDVNLRAAGDIAGVMVQVGGRHASVVAGQGITATAERGAMQFQFENTDATIIGRQGVQLGVVNEVGLMDSSRMSPSNQDDKVVVSGLAVQAALDVQATSGDVTQSGALPVGVDQASVAQVWPSDVRVSAPQGSIAIAQLNQAPIAGGDLSLLAKQDLSVGTLRVYARSPLGDATTLVSSFNNITAPLDTDIDVTRLEDASRRTPVRLIAEQGDVEVTASVKVDNPVRLIAGQDADIKELHVQHQTDQELTLVQAGRDVNFPGSGNTTQDLLIKGPGDAIVVAGRDINIDSTTGVQAIGNRENVALPTGSASLTLLAGVQPDGVDYQQAQSRYFYLLGGAGVADWAADLYAQITAVRAGQAAPELGSDAAKAFAQGSFSEQLIQARALVGQAAYEQAVLTHMQGRDGNPAMTLTQALAKLAGLPTREQSVLVGKVLAGTWGSTLTVDAQQTAALAMSAQRGNTYAAALTAYVQARTPAVATVQAAGLVQPQGLDDGTSEPVVTPPAVTAQTLSSFVNDLSADERLLFANQVLKSELKTAGRAAGLVTGQDAKLDAYQSGFNALETLFPGSKQTSSLLMGASNIKTLQDSDLTIVTPHGGMNVGRLSGTTDTSAAAKLGIVTTAGGSITGIVRDSVEVNQSRIFTVAQGDILLWASNGDIDAGKGAKTVLGAPPPLYRTVNGKVEVDTSGSFSGSGIAGLDEDSELDLYAPRGAINAGDAGIKAAGKLNIGATIIIGGNDIKTGNGGTLAPPPVVGNGSSSIGNLGQSATAAGPAADDTSRTAKPSKRRLLLDLLGFGNDDDEDQERDKKKDKKAP